MFTFEKCEQVFFPQTSVSSGQRTEDEEYYNWRNIQCTFIFGFSATTEVICELKVQVNNGPIEDDVLRSRKNGK